MTVIQPFNLPAPPNTIDPDVSDYLNQLRSAIQGLPLSYFSTSDGPNTSGVTAHKGTLGFELGSSGTRFWLKEEDSSNTTGWVSMSTELP